MEDKLALSDKIDSTPVKRKSDEKFCSSCSKVLHMSAQFCPSCGCTQTTEHHSSNIQQPSSPAGPLSDMKYCSGCGKQVHKSAISCPGCGAAIAKSENSGKKRNTAGLLAIFLGGFGVHKFYLGRPGWGFAYLLLCWTYVPAIVGLVEGIIYFSMDENSFHNKYSS